MSEISELILLELNKAERVAITGKNEYRDIHGNKQVQNISHHNSYKILTKSGNRNVLARMLANSNRSKTNFKAVKAIYNAGTHLRNAGKRMMDSFIPATAMSTGLNVVGVPAPPVITSAAIKMSSGPALIKVGKTLQNKVKRRVFERNVDPKTHQLIKDHPAITSQMAELQKRPIKKPVNYSKVNIVKDNAIDHLSTDPKKTFTQHSIQLLKSSNFIPKRLKSKLSKAGKSIDKFTHAKDQPPSLLHKINNIAGRAFSKWDRIFTNTAQKLDDN